MVGEAQDTDAEPGEGLAARFVVIPLPVGVVVGTVHFDAETVLRTVEIEDEAAYWNLAFEP